MENQTQALTYEQRSQLHSCQVARKLLDIVCRKKSNLCASLDVRTTAEMLALAEKVGPYVSLVKTHIDIIDDFDYETTIGGLTALAKKYDFLIFEDRKFADIGSTVKQQYAGGVYKIAQWSDFTNAHGVPGPGIVTGLSQAAAETTSEPRGLLMLAELSSAGSLAVGDYTAATIGIAQQNPEFVFGFIAQNRPKADGMDWLVMTPGVGLDDKGDNMGQQYRTVEDAVSKGSDIIIVGRGLFGKGRDPAREAERYREAGWNAYIQRLSN